MSSEPSEAPLASPCRRQCCLDERDECLGCGRTLQEIVDQDGYHALRHIEEQVLLKLSVENQVISTGGSAVYSDAAMRHLKANGTVVFLDIPLDVVIQRIGDYSLRGISRRPDQSLSELFDERFALYSRYADITVKGEGLTQDQVCEAVIRHLPN